VRARRPGGRWARFRLGWLLALLVVVTASCGVPTSNDVRAIDPDNIPAPFATPTNHPTTSPATGAPSVYLADQNGHLVATPVRLTTPASFPRDTLEAVLTQLAAGPSPEQVKRGLSSALPPAIGLGIVDVAGLQATLALDGDQLPVSDQTTLATAQIVLTATSVPGIDAVTFTRGGHQVEAPLVGGPLTFRPVTASDYRSLVTHVPAKASPSATKP